MRKRRKKKKRKMRRRGLLWACALLEMGDWEVVNMSTSFSSSDWKVVPVSGDSGEAPHLVVLSTQRC